MVQLSCIRYIMGPYYTSSEDFRLHFSDCYIFELQLVQLLVISPIQANSDNVSQRLFLSKSFVDPFDSIQTTNYLPNPWFHDRYAAYRNFMELPLILHIRNSSQFPGPAYLLPPHWPKLWLSHPSYEPLEQSMEAADEFANWFECIWILIKYDYGK